MTAKKLNWWQAQWSLYVPVSFWFCNASSPWAHDGQVQCTIATCRPWNWHFMGMKRILGWMNMMWVHHGWFHSSITIIWAHLIAFIWFTSTAWASELASPSHDSSAFRLMHPQRGGNVKGTPTFPNHPHMRNPKSYILPTVHKCHAGSV